MGRTTAKKLDSKCVEQVSIGKSKMKLRCALCSVTLSSNEGKQRLSTPKFVFWDIDSFELVIFKKGKDSGRTFDLSPPA